MKQFSVVGGGTMGSTIVAALLANEIATPAGVVICEAVAARRSHLEQEFGVAVTDDPALAASEAPVVFIAVKPQDFPTVAAKLQGLIRPEQLIVSIMAGITVEALRAGLGHRSVVRVMPNTPAQIAQGMLVWTASSEVSDEQRAELQRMLATMGREIYVPSERQIDMATAVSGSGPGFVFLLIEAMIEGGVQIGLPRELAEELVLQTVRGSAAFAQESDEHVAALRNMVTSPGGTTAAGLLAMENHGVRMGTMDAIIQAYRRATELGQ
ncbi:MAG TPA: pyrroline-5-carboxylate reductase [Dehalococcoidia bacterium]|nr:pyrroline-5-carboxylate reductase [Dehalococcoidia bacterium]